MSQRINAKEASIKIILNGKEVDGKAFDICIEADDAVPPDTIHLSVDHGIRKDNQVTKLEIQAKYLQAGDKILELCCPDRRIPWRKWDAKEHTITDTPDRPIQRNTDGTVRWCWPFGASAWEVRSAASGLCGSSVHDQRPSSWQS